MNNDYLIPANSKRSMLILGMFEPVDLMVVGIGGLISAILTLIFYDSNMEVLEIFKLLSPLLFTIVMVVPIPNHRNIWQLTVHVYTFFTNRRTYLWKGWCMTHGENDAK